MLAPLMRKGPDWTRAVTAGKIVIESTFFLQSPQTPATLNISSTTGINGAVICIDNGWNSV